MSSTHTGFILMDSANCRSKISGKKIIECSKEQNLILPWASIYLCSTYIVFTTIYIALHYWYCSNIILHVINNLVITKYIEYNLLELSQDGRLERPCTHLLWQVHQNHNYQQNNHLCKTTIYAKDWNLSEKISAT